MAIIYSPKIPKALQDTFEATDRCKAIRANQSEHGDRTTWRVEHTRETGGHLDFWLFGYDIGAVLPRDHLLVTLHPDRSESTVSIHFYNEGDQRLITNHYPHGASSPS
jgi:hypothetical protein